MAARKAAVQSAVTGFRNGASGDRLISSPSIGGAGLDQRINRRISSGEQAGIQFGSLETWNRSLDRSLGRLRRIKFQTVGWSDLSGKGS